VILLPLSVMQPDLRILLIPCLNSLLEKLCMLINMRI